MKEKRVKQTFDTQHELPSAKNIRPLHFSSVSNGHMNAFKSLIPSNDEM